MMASYRRSAVPPVQYLRWGSSFVIAAYYLYASFLRIVAKSSGAARLDLVLFTKSSRMVTSNITKITSKCLMKFRLRDHFAICYAKGFITVKGFSQKQTEKKATI